jgi:hypothetical protein
VDPGNGGENSRKPDTLKTINVWFRGVKNKKRYFKDVVTKKTSGFERIPV